MTEETKQIIDVVMDVAKVLNEKIDNVCAEVQEVKQRVSNLENRMTNLENRMTNLENRMTDLENRMTNLETTVTEMKSQMSVMAEDIVSIKLKNDSVDTTLISHTYEINRLRKAK